MYLPDWMWKVMGDKLIHPFFPDNIQQTSYDISMSPRIKLQCFQRKEYPDTDAYLFTDFRGCPLVAINNSTGRSDLFDAFQTFPALFQKGDSFLAVSNEYLTLPRFISMEFRLKSSAARAGLTHALAVWVDPGFNGQLVLELSLNRSCYVFSNKPIGQMIASIHLPVLKPYKSRYSGQRGVVGNKNLDNLVVVPEYISKEKYSISKE